MGTVRALRLVDGPPVDLPEAELALRCADGLALVTAGDFAELAAVFPAADVRRFLAEYDARSQDGRRRVKVSTLRKRLKSYLGKSLAT